MEPTDEALLDAWREGDDAAGNALLERYFERLFRFFRSRTAEGVDELIQRTMLSCMENRDRLRAAVSFRAYVFRLARNELYDHHARYRRRGDRHASYNSADWATDPSISRVISDEQARRQLLVALRALPIDLQVALELHYWEGMHSAELAEVLGIPTGTVKSRLRRAKEQLRVQLTSTTPSTGMVETTLTSLEAWAARLRRGVDDDPGGSPSA